MSKVNENTNTLFLILFRKTVPKKGKIMFTLLLLRKFGWKSHMFHFLCGLKTAKKRRKSGCSINCDPYFQKSTDFLVETKNQKYIPCVNFAAYLSRIFS